MGLWLSWESASLARRRSGVRVPSAPPKVTFVKPFSPPFFRALSTFNRQQMRRVLRSSAGITFTPRHAISSALSSKLASSRFCDLKDKSSCRKESRLKFSLVYMALIFSISCSALAIIYRSYLTLTPVSASV